MTDQEAVKRMKELMEFLREKCTHINPEVACDKCDMFESGRGCYDSGYNVLSGIIEHMEAINEHN